MRSENPCRFRTGSFSSPPGLGPGTVASAIPGEQWVINQRINTNVVECWRTQQPKARLICMGTRCTYDENLPLLGGNFLLGDSIRGLVTYAMTKRTRYVGLLALRKQFGLTHLHVVPSTLYGPGTTRTAVSSISSST